MQRGKPTLLTAVPALALFACGGDSAQIADAVVEDSAGVRIVRHTGTPDAAPSVTFAPEPLYRYGSDAGDYTFASIWDGVLLNDGSAAVFDVRNREVVLLGPDGAFGSVLASSGEGPGEVGFVRAMFAQGPDSLFLNDHGNSRFSLFVGGSLARTTRVPPTVTRAFNARGIDAEGRPLLSSTFYMPGFPDEWLPGYMVRFDPETGVVDTVASYKYMSGESNPVPGTGYVFVADGRFAYVRSDNPEVVWHRADGGVRQIVRWQLERRYLNEEHLNGIKLALLARYRYANPGASDEDLDRMTREEMARNEADLGTPLPFFTSPFADAEGRVWLPAHMPGGPREGVPPYTVISADGEWLGQVDGPPNFRILDVGWGRVLGVVRDEMDLESVVVYELVGG